MKEARIEDHPEFPFRSGHEEDLGLRARTFLGAPLAEALQMRLVEEFIILAHRYAFLERLIQGDILYELPVHTEILDEEGKSLEELAERLAAEERELLGCPEGPMGELPAILNELGIKVLGLGVEPGTGGAGEPAAGTRRSARPSGENDRVSPGASAGADLFGAFYFDGEVGPALLVGAPAHRHEASFVLAHEYGHLVSDVDPYVSRVCRWDPRTLENRFDSPEERRADRFARALLMPAASVRMAAMQLSPSGTGSAIDPRWEQLAAVFEVPRAAMAMRLKELELPLLGRRGASNAGDALESLLVESPSLELPERFVNLALAAYAHGILDTGHLARFLRTDEREARRIAEWAQIQGRHDEAVDRREESGEEPDLHQN